MAENNQTTDPLAESAHDPNPTEWPNALAAEDALPDTVRDPSLGWPAGGTEKGK